MPIAITTSPVGEQRVGGGLRPEGAVGVAQADDERAAAHVADRLRATPAEPSCTVISSSRYSAATSIVPVTFGCSASRAISVPEDL